MNHVCSHRQGSNSKRIVLSWVAVKSLNYLSTFFVCHFFTDLVAAESCTS